MNRFTSLVLFGVVMAVLPSRLAVAQGVPSSAKKPLLHFRGEAAPRPEDDVNAVDPADSFLTAYMAVEKAQKLEADGFYSQALAKYKDAAARLQQLRDKTPDWQPEVVTYRLGRTTEAIASLGKKIAAEGPMSDAARKRVEETAASIAARQGADDDRDDLRPELMHPILVW